MQNGFNFFAASLGTDRAHDLKHDLKFHGMLLFTVLDLESGVSLEPEPILTIRNSSAHQGRMRSAAGAKSGLTF